MTAKYSRTEIDKTMLDLGRSGSPNLVAIGTNGSVRSWEKWSRMATVNGGLNTRIAVGSGQ